MKVILLLLGLSLGVSFSFQPTSIDRRLIRRREGHGTTRTSISIIGDNNSGSSEQDPTDFFYIRPAMRGDIGRASKILSDGFFKDGTNFFTYQLERLETYLSLEAGFPKPDALHELFVACSTKNGQVIGMAELDVEQKGSRKADGPYLCNVSVDRKRLRQGIASRLVQECEQQVLEWNKMSGGNVPNSLYLKVRENNEAAIAMYDKFGYRTYMKEKDEKNDVDILVMRKKLDPSTYKGKISSQNNAGIRLDLSLSKPQ